WPCHQEIDWRLLEATWWAGTRSASMTSGELYLDGLKQARRTSRSSTITKERRHEQEASPSPSRRGAERGFSRADESFCLYGGAGLRRATHQDRASCPRGNADHG